MMSTSLARRACNPNAAMHGDSAYRSTAACPRPRLAASEALSAQPAPPLCSEGFRTTSLSGERGWSPRLRRVLLPEVEPEMQHPPSHGSEGVD